MTLNDDPEFELVMDEEKAILLLSLTRLILRCNKSDIDNLDQIEDLVNLQWKLRKACGLNHLQMNKRSNELGSQMVDMETLHIRLI